MRKKGKELRDALGTGTPPPSSMVPSSALTTPRVVKDRLGNDPALNSEQARGGSTNEEQPLPSFTPVPRRYRHDGWTPERQVAFIDALADTGCVTRAAAMVNMAQANCYTLRRAAGAEDFDRAWSAALDFGLKRLKDIAFERAIDGQLVPVFVGGKLMGYRRKRNDAILMFCLRHYGQDAGGKRTTINYFSTRATAGAVAGMGDGEGPPPPASLVPLPEQARGGMAEASTTTVRTVISGPSTGLGTNGESGEEAAALLAGFEGVAIDDEAAAAIAAALGACAARARAADEAFAAGGEAELLAAADDPGESFVRVGEGAMAYLGELEPPSSLTEFVPFVEGEAPWMLAGADRPAALVAWEEAQAAKRLEGPEVAVTPLALTRELPSLAGGRGAKRRPSPKLRSTPPAEPDTPTAATGGSAPSPRGRARP